MLERLDGQADFCTYLMHMLMQGKGRTGVLISCLLLMMEGAESRGQAGEHGQLGQTFRSQYWGGKHSPAESGPFLSEDYENRQRRD